MIENWTMRKRPVRLERRIDFDNYDLTRDFLDLTADLSEKEGFYPDMNFGRTHVNMSISLSEGKEELEPAQLRFAEQVNVFAPTNKITESLATEFFVERN